VEKRRYQRLAREVAVDIRYMDPDTKEWEEVSKSCSRNLSALGLLVTTDRRLELGDMVHLDFFLPSSPEHIKVRGRVVRVEELVGGEYFDIGLEFVNLDDLTLAKINALVIQDTSQ
jgi:Tfp pilus assembly protein PilZ